MLTNLTPASKAAQAEMESLGMVTKNGGNILYDASGHLKSMTDIQEILHDKLGKLTPQMQTFAEKVIFGQYALNGMSIITNESPAAFKKLADSMNTAGATMKALQDRQTGWQYSFMRLQAEFQTIQKEIGLQLRPVVDILTNALQRLMTWWQNLNPHMQKFIVIGTAVTAALMVLGGAIMTAVAGFAFMVEGITAAIGALSAISGAILPVTAIIAGVVIAVKALHDAWINDVGGIRQFMQTFIAGIKQDWQMVVDAFHNLVGNAHADGIKWGDVWKTVQVVIVDVVKTLLTIVSYDIKLLASIISGTMTEIKGIIQLVFGGIVQMFKAFFEVITGHTNRGFSDMSAAWSTAGKGLENIAKGIFTIINGVFAGFPAMALKWAEGLIQGLVQGIEKGVSTVVSAVQNIVSSIRNVWGDVTSMFSSTPQPKAPTIPAPSVASTTPKIPKFAEGGIVSKPTLAWVGEAGYPEAIVPLKNGMNQTGNYQLGLPGGLSRNGGFGGNTVNITGPININVPNGDAQSISRQLKIQLQRALG